MPHTWEILQKSAVPQYFSLETDRDMPHNACISALNIRRNVLLELLGRAGWKKNRPRCVVQIQVFLFTITIIMMRCSGFILEHLPLFHSCDDGSVDKVCDLFGESRTVVVTHRRSVSVYRDVDVLFRQSRDALYPGKGVLVRRLVSVVLVIRGLDVLFIIRLITLFVLVFLFLIVVLKSF
jgi:hypothetical protein